MTRPIAGVSGIALIAIAVLAFAASFAGPGTAHAMGAIAVDSEQASRYGYSYGHTDRRRADQRAISECGFGCRIAVRFSGGCAAYAADMRPGGTAWGWGTESNDSLARSRALLECRARAGYYAGRCAIRVSVCDR